jgi:hypothetical protein
MRIRWAGHVARMGKSGLHTVGEQEGKRKELKFHA